MRPLLITLPLFFAGCLGPGSPPPLARMYAESMEDSGTRASDLGPVAARRRERIAHVRELVEAEALASDLERLYAAAILLDSNEPDDLVLSRDLALTAAENGEEGGFPLAAEAIDRELMLDGLPQKYGTQYVFDVFTGKWILYQWDPTTSDVERQSMGVAPIAVAIERAKRLNDSSE